MEERESAEVARKGLRFVQAVQSAKTYAPLSAFFAASCATWGYFSPIPGLSEIVFAVVLGMTAMVLGAIGHLLQQSHLQKGHKHRVELHVATVFLCAVFAGFYTVFQMSAGVDVLRIPLALFIGALAGYLIVYPLVRQMGSAMKWHTRGPALFAISTLLSVFVGVVYGLATHSLNKTFSFLLVSPWILPLIALYLLTVGYAFFSKRDFLNPQEAQQTSLEKGLFPQDIPIEDSLSNSPQSSRSASPRGLSFEMVNITPGSSRKGSAASSDSAYSPILKEGSWIEDEDEVVVEEELVDVPLVEEEASTKQKELRTPENVRRLGEAAPPIGHQFLRTRTPPAPVVSDKYEGSVRGLSRNG